MTDDEEYLYKRAVLRGLKTQLTLDADKFAKATPQEAETYLGQVFTDKKQWVSSHMNQGQPYGAVPASATLWTTLTKAMQDAIALKEASRPQETLDKSALAVARSDMEGMTPQERGPFIQGQSPEIAQKLVNDVISPIRGRSELMRAISGLNDKDTAKFINNQKAQLPTEEEKNAFLFGLIKDRILSDNVMKEMGLNQKK
jgi:hypothetical protein